MDTILFLKIIFNLFLELIIDTCLMNKPMKNILPLLTQEEFCNITDLLFSKDTECKILAEEFLKPYVYDIIGNEIFLTKDFSIKPQFGGWFSRSDGS